MRSVHRAFIRCFCCPGRSAPQTSDPQSITERIRELKETVSSKARNVIKKLVTDAINVGGDNGEMEKYLEEFEQFYRVFHIANQFFDLPLPMPDPSECGIEEAYYLAIGIKQWKDQDREISMQLFKNNDILSDIFNNTQEMVKRGPPSTTYALQQTDDGKAW